MEKRDVIAFFDRCAASWDAEMIKSDTIIGITEYPSPRSIPTMTSITPQRKYVVQRIFIRFIPAAITGALSE